MRCWPVCFLFLSACAAGPLPQTASSVANQCRLSPSDQAWVDASMHAWDLTSRDITRVGLVKNLRAVFFDARCMVVSATAMNGGPKRWLGTLHGGQVQVPDGPLIPAGVISFATGAGAHSQFVMSTPSVWRAAKKSDNGLGSLETLMTAVVIHEANHVSQVPAYVPGIERLAKANNLPEDFSDDSIQERFAKNPEFAASIERETELFFASAAAKNDGEAKRLAREARALINRRHQRWFSGGDAYLREADDIWLTMEGSAQWAAYRWLIHPRGGRVPASTAFASFTKGRWWSQVQGFALFMALDRLAGESWKRHAFGDGAKTALQMLDEAIATGA